MFCYVIYGKKIYSDLQFPQLVKIPQIKENEADIVIASGRVPQDIKDMEGQKKWSFGENLSWLNNLTCWFAVEDGRYITYELKEGGREHYLKLYILGFGLSMAFMQCGEMTIHCSALSKDGKAVLVAGESGSGKSTTTTALLEAGFSLMADDMALVRVENGKAFCYPAFPYQKLCRDVVEEGNYDLADLIYIDEDKDKYLVPYEGSFDVNGKEVCAFFYLARMKGATELFTEEVTGINKFHVCVNNLFLRNLLREQKYAPLVGAKCLEIASKVNMFLIGRPEEGDTVKERTKYIIDKVQALISEK